MAFDLLAVYVCPCFFVVVVFFVIYFNLIFFYLNRTDCMDFSHAIEQYLCALEKRINSPNFFVEMIKINKVPFIHQVSGAQ